MSGGVCGVRQGVNVGRQWWGVQRPRCPVRGSDIAVGSATGQRAGSMRPHPAAAYASRWEAAGQVAHLAHARLLYRRAECRQIRVEQVVLRHIGDHDLVAKRDRRAEVRDGLWGEGAVSLHSLRAAMRQQERRRQRQCHRCRHRPRRADTGDDADAADWQPSRPPVTHADRRVAHSACRQPRVHHTPGVPVVATLPPM